MMPRITWRGTRQCELQNRYQLDIKTLYPQNMPYGEACWSQVDYVGDYVTLPFLLHVLEGDVATVKQKSGRDEARVVNVFLEAAFNHV